MPEWKADDGSLIHYELHGEPAGRPTLLLLPGLLGAIASQWQPFLPELSRHFRVILMDLRGHGRSENRAPLLEPDTMVADIVGLLDGLAVERVHIAGYSLGGYLGLMLALHAPRRVATLLMHATKFYWSKAALEKMRLQLNPDTMAEKVPTYANQLAHEHGSRWRMLVRQAGDLVAITHERGVTENMAAMVQTPVIVSVGDRDTMVPLPEAQRLSRAFPSGALLVLPNVSHPFPSVTRVPLVPVMLSFHRQPG